MYLLNEMKERLYQYEKAYRLRKLNHVHLEDIPTLSFDYKRWGTSEIAAQNDSYGQATILKQYAGLDPDSIFNFTIEHGLFLYKDHFYPPDIYYRTPMICMSDFRKNFLEKRLGKRAYAIGPYIAYAEEYYPKDLFQSEKARYGRILLVFPVHSSPNTNTNYNMRKFIREIESIRSGFDTVMVCMYARDIRRDKLWKTFMDMGYVIVSAGYHSDKLFLSRLKTILNLSDAVVMNAITAGLGYAVYMNKPCYVFKQRLEKEYSSSVAKYEERIRCEEYYKLMETFSDRTFQPKEDYREICNYVYGMDKVKSKEEMKELLMPLLVKR